MVDEKKPRMTRQRRVILEALKKTLNHPTASEVYEVVRKTLPRISLGTVYRNLEMLSACGMIRKLEGLGRQKRFEHQLERHHHIRCLACGRVDDIAVPPDLDMDNAFRDSTAYEILGHRVEFVGVCPHCRQ